MTDLAPIVRLKEEIQYLHKQKDAIFDTIDRKTDQAKELQISYIFEHNLLAGDWEMNEYASLMVNSYFISRAKKFKKLFNLLSLDSDELTYIDFQIPYGAKPGAGIVIIFDYKAIKIQFCGLTPEEILEFTKMANIRINIPNIEEQIEHNRTMLETLTKFKELG